QRRRGRGFEQSRWSGNMGDLHSTMMPGVIPGVARVVLPATEREKVPERGRSLGMDGIRELLEALRDQGLLTGHFRGVLHIAIGRKVSRAGGVVISSGATWRELAGLLKILRFDKELVREVGADPEALAPRDRQRFWYSAIALARPDSAEAFAEAERLIPQLKDLGFIIGPAPSPPPAAPTPAHAKAKATKEQPKIGKKEEKPGKRKKK